MSSSSCGLSRVLVLLSVSALLLLVTAASGFAELTIVAADDGTVSVVDVDEDEAVSRFFVGPAKIRETFVLEARGLAVVSQRDRATVWNIATGELVREVPRRIYAFAPDGQQYVTYVAGESGGLFVESTDTFGSGEELYPGDTGGPAGLLWSSDGGYLAVHFCSEYPLSDEQYPVPALEHAYDWVELFDLSTRSAIPEFREYESRFLGEFDGPAYYLRNDGILLGGRPWNEKLRFRLEDRRWEKTGGFGCGLLDQDDGRGVLDYDVNVEALGTDTKLGSVSVTTYQTWEDVSDPDPNMHRAGCLIQASFSYDSTAPVCCANWWQIVQATSWSLSNCGGNPGTLADPHIDSPHTSTYPHPRYNWPQEPQYSLYDRPSGPKTRPSGSIQFESYLGVEKGERSSGVFYVPGSTGGFRWGFDWDQPGDAITLKALTQSVQLTEAQMSTSLTNSCFSTADWSMEIEKPSNPCIEILEPTTSDPAFVGPYTDPTDMKARVRVGPDYTSDVAPGLTAPSFTVTIAGLPATVSTAVEKSKYYELDVEPPDDDDGIPSNGKYDLTVTAKKNSQEYKDEETESVEYTDARSVSVVLIIDRSGSMGYSGYMEPAKSAASQFVDLMLLDDQVGVVSFSSSAGVNYPLTVIASPAIKAAVQAAIAVISSGGNTSIGAGMQVGQSQLNSHAEADHAWALVLLSDGHQNTSPHPNDVLPSIPDRTDIYTIALGIDSDEALLETIALATGGAFYMAPSAAELQAIYNLIRGAVGGGAIVMSGSGTVSEGETDTQSGDVDDTVEKATFLLGWGGSDLDLTLVAPNGSTIDPTTASGDPDIEYVSAAAYEYYTVESPAAGEWTLRVYATDTSYPDEPYSVSITGESDLQMLAYLYEESLTAGQPIHVLVSIAEGAMPATGAQVVAEVSLPTRDPYEGEDDPSGRRQARTGGPRGRETDLVDLYDDGSHGDGAADDGVYGAMYSNTASVGTYTFALRATGTTSSGQPFSREAQVSVYLDPPDDHASLAGTVDAVRYGAGPHTVYVRTWLNDPAMVGQPDFLTEVVADSFPVPWMIDDLPPGTYSIDAFLDEDCDGGCSSTEMHAVADSTIALDEFEQFTGIDLLMTPPEGPSGDLDDVVVYPNPYGPDSHATSVTFGGLPLDATVEIYTIGGTLVRESAPGEFAGYDWPWDLKNEDGEDVARGVYVYHIRCSECGEDTVGKVAVIR